MTNEKQEFILANELRIGNWVIIISTGQIACITSVDKNIGVKVNNSPIYLSIDDIKPIPVTEEILLKCGFEKDNEYFSLKNLHYNIENKRFYIGNDHVSSGHNDAYILHLHQLQNLYFALTNQELEIEL